MKFTCIDFETANMRKDSICQVGITVVDNGILKETKSWLVNPDSFFDDFNIRIHHITQDMVKDSPKINELWPEIRQYFDDTDFVVAHNARFDVLAISDALNPFDSIEQPEFIFLCSIAMARRTWIGEPSYSLQSLCFSHDIEYGNHDAGSDSKSCAELVLRVFKNKSIDLSLNISSLEDLSALEDKLEVYFGILGKSGFANSVCRHLSKPKLGKVIFGDIEKNNPDSLFYKKNIVFTGTLSSMTRKEAMQIIADIGGIPGSSVTKETNLLVIGQQDFRIVGESGMSSKQKKALSMRNEGVEIEIMSEDEFLKNI